MTLFALSIVLTSALLHASWNAAVKFVSDRGLVLAAVSASHAALGLLLICIAGVPDRASWLYIFLSTVIHYGYYIFLFQSYRLGDLSQVYPISRGLAPGLVTLGAYLFLGETLGWLGWLGLSLIMFGIGFLACQRGLHGASRAALIVASLNGVLIASYSVADGIGVRLSGNPLAYMGWLFLLEFPVPLFIGLRRRIRRQPVDLRILGIGLCGGVAAVTAYGLVLYAKTIAPLGAVSAVRESSVIMAALIGLFLLGERPWRPRIISAIVVAVGVATLALSGS